MKTSSFYKAESYSSKGMKATPEQQKAGRDAWTAWSKRPPQSSAMSRGAQERRLARHAQPDRPP